MNYRDSLSRLFGTQNDMKSAKDGRGMIERDLGVTQRIT